jgi:hypothetical protein
MPATYEPRPAAGFLQWTPTEARLRIAGVTCVERNALSYGPGGSVSGSVHGLACEVSSRCSVGAVVLCVSECLGELQSPGPLEGVGGCGKEVGESHWHSERAGEFPDYVEERLERRDS